MGGLEASDPLDRGREQHPMAGLSGFDAKSGREMRFSCPGRSEQDHVLCAGEIVALGKVGDLVSLHSGLVVEGEVLERLPRREPSGLNPEGPAGGVAG